MKVVFNRRQEHIAFGGAERARSTQLGYDIGNRVAMRSSACGEVVTWFMDCDCFFSDCDSHLFS